MKTNIKIFVPVLGGIALAVNALAATAPAQHPMLNSVTGAKPNLMLNLDNSGSMSWPGLDSYANQRITDQSLMRAAAINPMYYNPAIYYRPRVNGDGSAYVPPANFNANSCVIQSNATTAKTTPMYAYNSIYANGTPATSGTLCTDQSNWLPNPNLVFLSNWGTDSSTKYSGNWGSGYYIGSRGPYYYGYAGMGTQWVTPIHRQYSNLGNVTSGESFHYITNCSNNTDCQSGSTRNVVDIYPDKTIRVNGNLVAAVPLTNGTQRVDCGATTDAPAKSCTWAQENANIVNWYNYYHSRIKAVTTAIGLAMADAKDKTENGMRVGYSHMNTLYEKPNGSTFLAADTPSTAIDRGVRYFTGADRQAVYDWMYSIIPGGGTPSHNSVQLVGEYYRTKDEAWKNDPTSSAALNTATDLSCRRSYMIFLSDGGWNANTQSFPVGYQQFASLPGITSFSGKPTINGVPTQINNFSYSPTGSSNRAQYVPYSDNKGSTYGLADLTAYYFWDVDMSPLPNNVPPTGNGATANPTFWQNMTSYMIGWGLSPTGEAVGATSGLTTKQIQNYQNAWVNGVANPTPPSWRTGNLNSSAMTDAQRVDDFIRAGYTGGGSSYSVWSANDVYKAFLEILKGMTGTGKDAGVGVSAQSGGATTLAGSYMFNTLYNTSNNTGDIQAFVLDANGNPIQSSGPAWSAAAQMPAPTARSLYALSNYTPGSTGTRLSITSNTKLSSLPTDLAQALDPSYGGVTNIPTDTTFIQYLLGVNGLTDTNGTLFRVRDKPIGASVNSAPVFVGSRLNMVYDQGSVAGANSYAAYRTNKNNLTSYPPTIFSANNDGMVHVFNAAAPASTTAPAGPSTLQINGAAVATGVELAAYMPKSAMAGQKLMSTANGYQFQYVLDGPLAEHDVFDANGVAPSGGKNTWRDLVYGGGGRASRSLFALESPLNNSAAGTNRVPNQNHFLWEVNSGTSGYSDLGFVTNSATAGQLDDGSWVTLTNSGHYAGTGNVGLYVMDALTGAQKYFVPLPSAYSANNRGLGGVVAIRNLKKQIVGAYAGDSLGNLWRFDLRTQTVHVSYGQPLFQAPGQAIYAAPSWQTHPGDGATCNATSTGGGACGNIVNFGTGILLEDSDVAASTPNALYGIWDPTPIGGDDVANFKPVQVSDLLQQQLQLSSALQGASGTAYDGKTFYAIQAQGAMDWTKLRGWTLPLGVVPVQGVQAGGERVIGDAKNLGASVVLTSVFVPAGSTAESCTSSTLPNMVYVIDALTGSNQKSFTNVAMSAMFVPGGGYTQNNALTVYKGDAGGMDNEGKATVAGTPPVSKSCVKAWLTGATGTSAVERCPSENWNRTWRAILNPPAV